MAENPQSHYRQRALNRWLKILASSSRVPGSKLEANPTSPGSMSQLLAHAHAPAARAIFAPGIPMCRASIPSTSSFKRGQDSRTLRVSFGIFPVIGRCQMMRVIAYQVEPFGRGGVHTKKDQLWDTSLKPLGAWDGVEPVPKLTLSARADVVFDELRKWFTGFQSSSVFLMWQKQCLSKYEEEKRQLSVLYNDYSLTQKIGLRDEPGGYQATLEDEYRGRMMELVDRYELGFRAVTLSVVEIRCNAIRLKSGTVKLPFLAEPL
jgi:hypothetical protein